MTLRYGWEKFHLALVGLAVGDGSLPKRVDDAFAYNLQNVESEDVPEDVWVQLAKYKKDWLAGGLDPGEMSAIAGWIVESEFQIRALI